VAPDPAEAGAGDDTEPDTRPMARMVERSTAPTV
jgi:hypothetical protein